MEKKCSICNKINNSQYTNFCKSCYQTKWASTIKDKICIICLTTFKHAGKKCRHCQRKKRLKNQIKMTCCSCLRSDLLIMNKTLKLCNTCLRRKRESEDPTLKQKRTDRARIESRKLRGTPLDAPIRVRQGTWKTKEGYVITLRYDHPNASSKGSIFVHTLNMSEKIGRPLRKGETVHHINGIKDDNRIENLELWSSSHGSGQRVEDKIEWAKQFLESYGYIVEGSGYK